MCNIFPEIITIGVTPVGYQHIPQRVPVRCVIAVGAIADLHIAVVFIRRPQSPKAIEEIRQSPPALLTYVCFVKNRITLKKPIRYTQCIAQRLPAFAKNYLQRMREPLVKVIILLHMPEFVYRQLLMPGQAADIKAILLRCEVKLAPERRQAHISIRNGSLILQHYAYLLLLIADSWLNSPIHLLNDACHPPGNRIKSGWKYNFCRRCVHLAPFD